MSEDRFVVVAVTGWTIRNRGNGDHDRRRDAYHLCAELNALEAEYEAMHA